MNFSKMMDALSHGTVSPRTKIESGWSEKGGIYSIWGNEDLKKKLLPKKLELHASKQNAHQVTLSMRKAIERSAKRLDADGKELFCFYVGKTAHLKKRMAIQRYEKVWPIINITNSRTLKEMLHISFSEIGSWEERFFAEGYAIAKLLPVLNAQPER